MNRLRAARLVLLALLLATAAAADDPGKPLPPGPEGEIVAAERERVRALVEADLAALRELFAEELRFTHANGTVDTKYVFLAALESGRLDYLSIRTRDEAVRVYGEAGVAAGNATLQVKTADGARRTLANVYTAVYVKRDGAWRLVAYQSTPAEKAQPAGR